jgi:hypothetical protein
MCGFGKIRKSAFSLPSPPLGFYAKVGCRFTATIFCGALLNQKDARSMQIQLVIAVYIIYI